MAVPVAAMQKVVDLVPRQHQKANGW